MEEEEFEELIMYKKEHTIEEFALRLREYFIKNYDNKEKLARFMHKFPNETEEVVNYFKKTGKEF